MEPLLFFVFLLLPIFLSLSYLFSPKLKDSNGNANLPLGKTGWPLIGETLDLAMMGRKGTPEKFFQGRMNKYSQEIFRTSLLGEQTAVFCGVEGNKFLFSNENKLVTLFWPRNIKKMFPTSLLSSGGEESRKLRPILLGFLKPELLQKYVEIVDTIANKHLDMHWNFHNKVTVLPLAKKFTFTLACRLFLSIDDPNFIENLAKPFHVMAAGMFSVPVNFPGTSFSRGIKSANLTRKKLLDIIRQRKGIPMGETTRSTHDILSHMLAVRDKNGQFMSEPEIADKLMALLLSSQDSTSTSITFIMKYLAEFPQFYIEVLKEQRIIAQGKQPGELLNWKDLQKMKYSWRVASEVMRLMPPVQGSFREAMTDFTYSGFLIPKGFKLYWTPNTTHKNPKYFPEPEKFDPSRFEGSGPNPYAYVPFGGGSRICPGKELARVIILVFIYNIVGRFKWEKLLPNEKTLVETMPVPAEGFPIHLIPH